MIKATKIILEKGDVSEMRNTFKIAEQIGGGTKNELTCMLGYMICSFRGYIKPHSEGWYFLSEKGDKARKEKGLV